MEQLNTTNGKMVSTISTDAVQLPTAPLELQWPPPEPASTHTINLRLNMMNQDPKDLHTARAMIEELRSKVRFQTEHIIKWRKAYAVQVQQHYRYQKEKADQMNSLTSQLLLLESRLKRKQKQIASLLNHRELTIQRQQKIIEKFGICTESANDSDSAIVLEDINDFDCTNNRKFGIGSMGGSGGGNDDVTVVRSISDAIETNLSKYGGSNRRNNCYLRRPDILETVYSVEEDPEPSIDVAEKRDKFRNRSDKALSSSSTEGHIDQNASTSPSIIAPSIKTLAISDDNNSMNNKTKEQQNINNKSVNCQRKMISKRTPSDERERECSVKSPTTTMPTPTSTTHKSPTKDNELERLNAKTQVHNFNRIMSNHRSVTKPKDVKYKRINKAKSKSLEELRGRLKNLVERGNTIESGVGCYNRPQTAHSYA